MMFGGCFVPELRVERINIIANDKGEHAGELTTQLFSSGERTTQALKVLGLCWLLAGITLFIPIAHFFLVPLFLVAGPVMAFSKYRVETATDSAEGICPECGESVSISLDPADKLPKWTYCPKCNKPLHLVYDGAS